MLSVTDADDRPPIEQALEVFVYAPLGFALEARTLLPRFIERGRNQVVLARVIGKYAVARGAASAEGAAVEAQERTLSILRQVGLLAPDETAEPPPVPGDDGEPTELADSASNARLPVPAAGSTTRRFRPEVTTSGCSEAPPESCDISPRWEGTDCISAALLPR